MKYYINEINKNGTIAVDDTLLIKGTPATAGSKMLESFTPLFSAEVVDRLEKAGYEFYSRPRGHGGGASGLYRLWLCAGGFR